MLYLGKSLLNIPFRAGGYRVHIPVPLLADLTQKATQTTVILHTQPAGSCTRYVYLARVSVTVYMRIQAQRATAVQARSLTRQTVLPV